MVTTSTMPDIDYYNYLCDRTPGEDEFLRKLVRASADAQIPPAWIAPEQGSFLQILLKLSRAREVVEIGTLTGYAAIWMARALPPEGRVRTIEINAKYADFAEKWIGQSDVARKIDVIRGDAKQVLPTIAGESVDAVLVDADKASYPLFLRESLRILRKGGLLLVDNAFAFGLLFDEMPMRKDVAPIRSFNNLMGKTPGHHSIIVPLGDGCWVGVKE